MEQQIQTLRRSNPAISPVIFVFAVILFTIAPNACPPAWSQQAQMKYYEVKGDFESVVFDLKDAILSRSLTIDHIGQIDRIAAREAKKASGLNPYINAQYLQFCDTELYYDALSADKLNISLCPHLVFVFEPKSNPGVIFVGYQSFPTPLTGSSATAARKIEKLLDGIVKDATGN